MQATLEVYTRLPDLICGQAAAICTGYDGDPVKALRGALKSGHESVAEHATFTFRVEGVSRALLAQLTRHRIASFAVQSQRYCKVDTEANWYVIPPSIADLGADAVAEYAQQMDTMGRWYREWCHKLGDDRKEDARFVLPNAAATELYVTLNARELRHFFALRCCNRAQWEIRALADEMLRQCKEVAPVLFADAGPGCVRGRCPEGSRSCGEPRRGDTP